MKKVEKIAPEQTIEETYSRKIDEVSLQEPRQAQLMADMNDDLLKIEDLHTSTGPDFQSSNAKFLARIRKQLADHEHTSEHLKLDLDCVLARREDLLQQLYDKMPAEF